MGKFYSKLFAKFYDSVIRSFEQKIANDRKLLLENLEGKLIDVGSGTGVNFQYFNFFPFGGFCNTLQISINKKSSVLFGTEL